VGHRTSEREKEGDDVRAVNRKNYSQHLLLPTMVEIDSESSSKNSLDKNSQEIENVQNADTNPAQQNRADDEQ